MQGNQTLSGFSSGVQNVIHVYANLKRIEVGSSSTSLRSLERTLRYPSFSCFFLNLLKPFSHFGGCSPKCSNYHWNHCCPPHPCFFLLFSALAISQSLCSVDVTTGFFSRAKMCYLSPYHSVLLNYFGRYFPPLAWDSPFFDVSQYSISHLVIECNVCPAC